MENLNLKRLLLLGVGISVVIFLLFAGKWVENVDNSEIVTIQSAWSGKVTIYTQPGPVPQMFGTATHYKKRNQFWFSKNSEEGETNDQSIKVRFNDGGHGQI